MSNQLRLQNVKWSVFWYRNGKLVRKRFGDDLHSALQRYRELDNATLHSDNVGFPPPDRITKHPYDSWEIVTRRRKRYKKKITKFRNLMRQYNEKGIWWCPYCIQLRRFKELLTTRGLEMYCPVCQITNYDFHVRKHNPKAVIVEMHKRQRRPNANRRRRQRLRKRR